MSLTPEGVVTELRELMDSLDDHVTPVDVYGRLEDLVEEINEGTIGRPHMRVNVEVNAEQQCTDQECSHEGGCPTREMIACLGCSQPEPDDDGMTWFTGWATAEAKHHVDYYVECTPECTHLPINDAIAADTERSTT
jgi:hypothetical protein